MYASVNGIRLFFDVDGAGLVPDGPTMRQKPVMLLLHGGPGSDHSGYKPVFGQLADLVQIIYLDHRGCGRSRFERFPGCGHGVTDDDPVRAFAVIRDFIR